jgi:hypothetical protein
MENLLADFPDMTQISKVFKNFLKFFKYTVRFTNFLQERFPNVGVRRCLSDIHFEGFYIEKVIV